MVRALKMIGNAFFVVVGFIMVFLGVNTKIGTNNGSIVLMPRSEEGFARADAPYSQSAYYGQSAYYSQSSYTGDGSSCSSCSADSADSDSGK
jgi:hypothetical protein